MTIGSTGSISFWQQDQNFWNQAQAASQSSASSDALITAVGSLMTNEVKGLASIANKTALDRVNAQFTAALQSAVQSATASSDPSSSSSSASSVGAPAIGTGTVPLSASTALITLGIPANGKVTVSDGTNTTTYTSTGTDTVANLISAINKTAYGNAQVTATLNASGQLVLTGDSVTDSITVGGLFASNIGFGTKNDSFQPTAPAPAPSTASTTSNSSSTATSSTSSASSSTGSSTSTSTSSPGAVLFNSSYALQTGGTAETLLASDGLSGSLLNLLA
jgi:peptidoglycan DL-endopeptidase CwlO